MEKTEKTRVLGGLYLLSAAFLYSLYGLFSRNIADFSPFAQNFIRSSMVFFILFLFFFFNKKKWINIQKKDTKWFLLWVIPSSFQMVLSFVAFNHLAIGTTYYIIYSTMILGSFLSGKLFFSERLTRPKIISLVLVLSGLTFIYGFDVRLTTNIYVFFALLSGLIVGFWNTLTKKLSGNYSEFQMLFVDSFATSIVSFGGFKYFAETLPSFKNLRVWCWITIFALATISTTFLLIRGFKKLEAQIGSLILPMEVVFASLVGYLFLGEVLSVWTYLGGGLIFISSLYPHLSKKDG